MYEFYFYNFVVHEKNMNNFEIIITDYNGNVLKYD